ncbi:FdhF/YdeP family oxidoreductase [Acidisphaera sp. L21]|uniref:FdhF/YdeP family oxidoreductase n=1 Tax=Acidisphaera sp. L21 TaxID=1641851 RepID=UPI00131ADC60|nr:FdhF/YdeP family oxidoreductase [Acidisphaera sp. L21]
MSRKPTFKPYDGPSGGWGSARSLGNILRQEGVLASGTLALTRQNKPDGFQCVSCAWPKPASPLPFEFCENGAKATAWEITTHRCTPAFFAEHTVTDMLAWDDYHLEKAGRLTHPMRYDKASDKYLPVSWESAFEEIGRELRAIEDKTSVVFYSSGRSSNEASYLYAMFARLYGNNNLPDSSNMCHETTSVALPQSIGVPVGTVTLDDFAATDCILFFGQNPGSNSPRMLHPLEEASKRGVPIITYNPLRERGLERFTNPQSPVEMLSGEQTRISSQYNQVKAGGDLAALTGICKAVVAMDDASDGRVLDHGFIQTHTHGFEELAAWLRVQDWAELERHSGLTRLALERTATTYAHAKAVLGIYGMGLTQHRAGVETVQMLVNLLLLKGNIGRPGAGISPVRGHSNVQGQRTVGITEKPELVPMDKLARQYGFEPPREAGYNTVEACEAILEDKIRAFIMLGGNFVRAIPDRDRMEPAWRRMRLTVNVATKLNRSHLVHGEISYILPVKGRIEVDQQATGPQATSMEDSSACIHGSRGVRAPASKHLISEIDFITRLAKVALQPNPHVPWRVWNDDYSTIRKSIAETYPETFHDYETRMWEPGGFHRDLPARKRVWKTKTGKANFIVPKQLEEDTDAPEMGLDVLRLITLRSNDQFNTTVYGYSDRFRGIEGTRMVLLMNQADIERLGFREGEVVGLETVIGDGFNRQLDGLRVTPYGIPAGCLGAYYPEANVLLPLAHYAQGSKTPAAKSIPVRVRHIANPIQLADKTRKRETGRLPSRSEHA